MAWDYAKVFEVLKSEIHSQRTIRKSMARLIDYCETSYPHHDWRRFHDLPFDNLTSLKQWIVRPFHQEPPSKEINGLWFGLFNPVIGGEPVTDMYVCGSRRFKAKDDTFDWASGPEWWPKARYAGSEVLEEIYRIAYQEQGLGNMAEEPLCLGYAALVIRELLTPPPDAIQNLSGVGIAVGYDSGDGILLGKLGPEGLTAREI